MRGTSRFMIKRVHYIVLGCFAVCIAILILILVKSSDQSVKIVSAMRQLLTEERMIIHAGGYIAGADGQMYNYTNSLDALRNSYEAGNRVCEIHFILSADNELICSHHNETDEAYWAVGLPFSTPVTVSEFLDAKVFDRFQTMSLEELANYMRAHKDLYIVTDIKSDIVANEEACKKVKSVCPDLAERFIIQIYHESEYAQVRALGFPYIIYTLYATSIEERQPSAIQVFVNNHELVGLTCPATWADDELYAQTLDAVEEGGTTLFVHTVNDVSEMKRYFAAGISGVYTDLIDNDSLRRQE